MKRILFLVLVVVMVFVFVTSGSASPLAFQSPLEAMSKPEFYSSPIAIPDTRDGENKDGRHIAPIVAPAVEVVALSKMNDFPAPPRW